MSDSTVDDKKLLSVMAQYIIQSNEVFGAARTGDDDMRKAYFMIPYASRPQTEILSDLLIMLAQDEAAIKVYDDDNLPRIKGTLLVALQEIISQMQSTEGLIEKFRKVNRFPNP